MNIGKNIAQMRKHKKMYQEDLAFKIGIHRVALSNIERGETSVSFDRVLKICDELNCDIEDLINIKEYLTQVSSEKAVPSKLDMAMNDINQSYQLQVRDLYLRRLKEILPHCSKTAMNKTIDKLSLDINAIMNNSATNQVLDDQLKLLEYNLNQYFSHALKAVTPTFNQLLTELISDEF